MDKEYEQQLAQQVKEGKSEDFVQLLKSRNNGVRIQFLLQKWCNTCLDIHGVYLCPKEIAQEVYLKAWQGLCKPGFELRVYFLTWLYPIAMHEFATTLKKAIRFRVEWRLEDPSILETLCTDWVDPEAKMTQEMDSIVIKQAILSLPNREKDSIILKYFDGFSNKETAEILRITPNYVGVILNRARNRLGKNPEILKLHRLER